MGFKNLFVKSDTNQFTNDNDINSVLKSIPMKDESQTENIQIQVDDSNDDIYKVVPFIDSLPSTLDTITKKTTLQSILKAANMDIEHLKQNADKVIAHIENNLQKQVELTNNDITSINEQIKNMEEQIKSQKEYIEERKEYIQNYQLESTQRINNVRQIKSFLE